MIVKFLWQDERIILKNFFVLLLQNHPDLFSGYVTTVHNYHHQTQKVVSTVWKTIQYNNLTQTMKTVTLVWWVYHFRYRKHIVHFSFCIMTFPVLKLVTIIAQYIYQNYLWKQHRSFIFRVNSLNPVYALKQFISSPRLYSLLF